MEEYRQETSGVVSVTSKKKSMCVCVPHHLRERIHSVESEKENREEKPTSLFSAHIHIFNSRYLLCRAMKERVTVYLFLLVISEFGLDDNPITVRHERMRSIIVKNGTSNSFYCALRQREEFFWIEEKSTKRHAFYSNDAGNIISSSRRWRGEKKR